METTLDYICNVRLYQPKDGYRFSVDALLLNSFIGLKRVLKIADLGAGSGIIGILLAGKYPESNASLFELQKNLAKLAKKNIVINRLEDRVEVINCDIRNLRTIDGLRHKANSYDLAVSNPPFRKPLTGLISPEEGKAIARHEIMIDLASLIAAAFHLLKHSGRFCMIYHPERLLELLDKLRQRNLEPKKMRFVHSNTSSEAKMVMVEAVKEGRPGLKILNPLFVYNKNGVYTEEMNAIYTG